MMTSFIDFQKGCIVVKIVQKLNKADTLAQKFNAPSCALDSPYDEFG